MLLAKLMTMVEATGDRREVIQASGDVTRAFFEDGPAVLLGEVPPRSRFPDGDECRMGSLGPAQRWRARDQGGPLGALHVPLITRDAPQGPGAALRQGWLLAVQDSNLVDCGQRTAGHGVDALNAPGAGLTARKPDVKRSNVSHITRGVTRPSLEYVVACA